MATYLKKPKSTSDVDFDAIDTNEWEKLYSHEALTSLSIYSIIPLFECHIQITNNSRYAEYRNDPGKIDAVIESAILESKSLYAEYCYREAQYSKETGTTCPVIDQFLLNWCPADMTQQEGAIRADTAFLAATMECPLLHLLAADAAEWYAEEILAELIADDEDEYYDDEDLFLSLN